MSEHGSEHARHWTLDPSVDFLNHGSFGACPAQVLQAQQELRARMERQPVAFFMRELPALLDAARAELAELVDADPDDLAFVANATTGVNGVLRSLALQPGDELLTTDHAYRACHNALGFVAQRAGARLVVAAVPFPVRSEQALIDAVLARVGPRTRLAMLDHVTSPTALVFPIERLVAELSERGIDTLVDGAHAPGMLPLSLRRIGAAYYTGNCHKWLCAPKAVGFLHVRRDRQAQIRPLAISHGAGSTRRDRSLFLLEHDWTGTLDPTPALCMPAAIRFLAARLPSGLAAVYARNHALAVAGRARLCDALGAAAPCPDALLGSMAAVPLPLAPPAPAAAQRPAFALDPLQDTLLERHRIEVPLQPWPAPPARLLRISAQLYNHEAQYQRLASALREHFAAG